MIFAFLCSAQTVTVRYRKFCVHVYYELENLLEKGSKMMLPPGLRRADAKILSLSCPRPVDLFTMASFVFKITFYKFRSRRMNGQVENITPQPPDWPGGCIKIFPKLSCFVCKTLEWWG